MESAGIRSLGFGSIQNSASWKVLGYGVLGLGVIQNIALREVGTVLPLSLPQSTLKRRFNTDAKLLETLPVRATLHALVLVPGFRV